MMITLNLLMNTDSHAASWETLMMPGKVVGSHAEYETECKRCHNRFDKQAQTRLCLDCHDKVDLDLQEKQGYHGRNPSVARQECKSCHTEHQGRDADIMPLNAEVFDHSLTDFSLKGAHQRSSCLQCHSADKQYREAPHECIDCHKKDDAHNGKLGKACADCHNPQRWDDTRFDHGKTDFKLLGKHEQVACNGCHLQQHYKDTSKECVACHRSNDVHRGRNGDDCAACHNSERWDHSRFDHDRDTDFRLKGQHRDASCESCHREPVEKKQPPTDCIGCHRTDDEHQGRFGKQCADCHQETDWSRVRFDHDRQTDFPLHGQHKQQPCLACHKGTLQDESLTAECIDCHRADDVHGGQQGEQCSRCHQESSWGDSIAFDHDLSKFPLIGLHASTPCEECHISARFQDAPKACIDCHREDDPHKASLGTDCALCHTPNAWSLWRFDHNRQTDFTLDGAHENLSCDGCHRTPLSQHARVASDCHGCHQQDDTHHGSFGRRCERCHTTGSFSDVRLAQ